MNNIKKLKEFYKIGREALHLISGISSNALMRYEKGVEPPHKFKLLINAMLNIETFETLFHASKSQMKSSDIDRIEKKIISELQWRERQVREYRQKIMSVG